MTIFPSVEDFNLGIDQKKKKLKFCINTQLVKSISDQKKLDTLTKDTSANYDMGEVGFFVCLVGLFILPICPDFFLLS